MLHTQDFHEFLLRQSC